MRSLVLLVCLICFSGSLAAQCSHDPTITPSNPILCPFEPDTLWTQSYDSYQWYKDGELISGATNQYLVVDPANDVLASFTVEATVADCSELSPGVLVDSWLFLLPFVSNEGDYTFNNGVFEVCLKDTIRFELGLPYDTNVQWTADGSPVDGETNPLIQITSSDTTGIVNYNVCGSPSVCPNYSQCLGVPLNVQFVDCGVVGVEDHIGFELDYKVFPNPSSGLVTIKSNTEPFGTNYTIFDQLGRIISSGFLASKNTELDIRAFSSGVYFIRIGENTTLKLMKE